MTTVSNDTCSMTTMSNDTSNVTTDAKQHPVLKDTCLWTNAIPADLKETVLQDVLNEVTWHEMVSRHGNQSSYSWRALQGDMYGHQGNIKPIYRCPAERQPPLDEWTPTIRRLRDLATETLKRDGHTKVLLNHASLQLYCSDDDHVAAHATKTLDVLRGSPVAVRFSLGSTRNFVLRPKRNASKSSKGSKGSKKKSRVSSRSKLSVPLPHGSLLCLGWETNRCMTHQIVRKDSQLQTNHSETEKFIRNAVASSDSTTESTLTSTEPHEEFNADNMCISITFRHVATYCTPDGKLFGQGAPKFNEESISSMLEPRSTQKVRDETRSLLKAFLMENRYSDFDWDKHYGQGFSVLNKQSLRKTSEAASRATRWMVNDKNCLIRAIPTQIVIMTPNIAPTNKAQASVKAKSIGRGTMKTKSVGLWSMEAIKQAHQVSCSISEVEAANPILARKVETGAKSSIRQKLRSAVARCRQVVRSMTIRDSDKKISTSIW